MRSKGLRLALPLLIWLGLATHWVKAQTTVTYPQRIANYYSNWTTGTAGAFDQGSFQVGMYANGGGTKQVVSWRKFRTDASGSSTSDRAMQVGDQFVVRISATRAFGKMGFALLASPGTGSWANRESNYAVSFNMDGPGYSGGYTWYAKYSGGSTSTGSNNVNGQQTTYKDFTFTLTLTAPDRMNATWTDGVTTSNLYDIPLNTSNPITDYSIFLEDDWDGGANRNIFWGLGAAGTQHALTNNGVLSHGQSNNSYTVSGVMTNGLDANSASSNALNNSLTKIGTGTVTLSGNNTYAGTTTVTAGTLQLGAADRINDNSNMVLNGGTFSTGAGAGFNETVGTLSVTANSTIALGTGAHTLTFANSSATTFTSGTILTITGWTGTNNGNSSGTAGKIFFGNSAGTLTGLQLSRIRFNISSVLYGAMQLSTGEIVPSGGQVLYYGGATGTWTGNLWGTAEGGPYTSPWVPGRHAIMNIAGGTLTGATTSIAALSINAAITYTAGGTWSMGPAGAAVGPIYVDNGITFSMLGQGISTVAGNGLIKLGAGILQGANGNAFTGGFTLNNGMFAAGGVNAMGDGGTLTINGGTLAGTANRDFSNKLDLGITIGGDFTLGSSTSPASGTANLTFNNNTALGSSVTRTITLGGTGLYSWNGIISGTSSNLTLAATAAGTLALGGVNTYGGNTTINGGTLRPTVAGALPTTTGLIFGNFSGAILDLQNNGLSHTVVSLSGGGTTGGNISFGAATTTSLTVNQSANTTYSGVISGASLTTGGLVKTGTGILTLDHTAHTYTGTTTITNGELRLNPTANATFASQVVLNGGKLSTTGIAATRTWTSSNTLRLDASSTIDLGSNAHTLTFANSSGVTWGAFTITINGWTGTGGSSGTAGKIFFGNTTGTLTAGQLAKITFTGYPGTPILLGTGELVPAAPGVAYEWNGSQFGGSWNNPLNWTPNGVPGAGDDVTINIPGPNPLNITSSVNCNNFTFNGSGTFSMSAAGALSIFGNVTYGGSATATMNCASQVFISSTSPQTIPPLNYGNLNASGGDRTLPSTGTVGICGTFTRGAGTYAIASSTVDFNGTGAQTIAAGTYNNLTISNARGSAVLTSPAGAISVAGVFDVSTLSAYTPSVNASSIFDFTNAGAQTIPAFFYGQLNNTGGGNRTWASSGIIDISQGFSPGGGTHTITGSTIRYSNQTATTWNLTTFTTNVASRQYNNLIFNGSNGNTTWSLNGNTIGLTGDLTVSGGTLLVGSSGGAATLNVEGNMTLSGGTLNPTNSASLGGTINLFGNYLQNGGAFNKSAAGTSTINFVKSTGTQTIQQTSGTITNNGTTWNFGNGSTTQTIQLISNFVVGAGTVQANHNATIDFQTFELSGTAAFTAIGTSPGTTLKTAHASGINTSGASGSVRVSGTKTFTNNGVNYYFNGTSAQNTGTALNPASSGTSIRSLTIDNPTTVTVTSSGGSGNSTDAVQITNNLNLVQGILILDTRDIQLNASTTLTGAPFSDTKMIATIGTTNRNNGRLLKLFPATSASNQTFTFPMGDVSGTAEYTPFSVTDLDYATAGGGPFIGIKVKDNRAPFDAVLNDYLTRTFEITTGSSFNGATAINFTFSANYITGASDVVGNDALFKVNRFSYATGTWTEDAASSCGGGTLVSAALTAQGDFIDHDITGRVNADIYFRSVATGNWETPGTWEASTDPTFVSPAPVTPSVAPIASNSAGILVRNTHNVTVTTLAIIGGLPLDQTVVNAGGTVTIQASCALNILDGTGVDMEVSGSLINQSASASTVVGLLQFKSGAVYDHAINSGTIPTATWDTGSDCRITGVTTTAPAGLGQSFSDFTWSCSGMSSLSLGGGLTTVGRDFTVSNTNSAPLGLTATTALALTVGRDFLVSGTSFVTLCTGSTTSPTAVSMSVAGQVNISAGGFTVAGGASSGTGSVSLSVSGTFTNASTTGTSFVLNGNTKTNVTATISGLYTKSGSGTVSLGQAASGASTLTCNGGLTVSSGNFYVANGGPSNLVIGSGSTFTVNGGNFIGSNTAHTSQINANGPVSVSSGTLTLANIASANSFMYLDDNQTMTVSGTGVVTLASAGQGGLIIGTISTSNPNAVLNLSGGTINLSTGGTGTITAYGDMNLNSGTMTRTAGTGTITFRAQGTGLTTPKLQTITQTSATVSGTITVNIGINGPSYSLLQLGSNVDFGSGSSISMTANSGSFLDFGLFTLTGLNFTQNAGVTMITAHPDGFNTILTGNVGSLLTTNTRTLSTTGGQFIYNGTSAQSTGTALTGGLVVSIFNTSGVTLSTNLNIAASGQMILFLTGLHGKLYLANFNLTMTAGSAIVGASSADYIVTNGTGRLIQTVGASNLDFPVGLSAYNPIRLFNSGTSDVYRVRVIDGVTSPAANDDTKLINRYWDITEGVAGGSTLSTSTFLQYNGGEENANFSSGSTLKIGYFNGIAWTDYAATQSGSDPYTVSPNASFSPAVASYTLGIGKDDGFLNPSVNYVWNGSQAGGLWTNSLNWTPNGNPTGLDNVTIPDVGSYTNELNITGVRTVNDFQVNANGKFSMAAGSSLSVGGAYTYSSTTPSTFNCSSTLILAGSGSITVPAANYGNLDLTGGPRTLASSGVIGICGTYTPGTPMTITGSTIDFNGTGAQTINAIPYNNLTISNARGSANLTSPAGTIAVGGVFDVSTLSAYTPVVNAASIFDFTSAGSQTIPAFFYGQLNNSGNGARTLANTGVIDINQGFTPTTGTTTITGSSVRYSNTSASAWTLTTFTTNVAGRQYNNLEFAGGASTSWEPGAGFNPGVAGNLTVSGGTLRIANTTTSNTLTVDGNTSISSGTIQVVGSTASAGITGTLITNDLTISGTGKLNLDAATTTQTGVVTVNQDLNVTSTIANAIDLGSGGATSGNTINIKRHFTKSGIGTLGLSGTYNATAIYNFNGTGTQTWSHSGAAMTGGGITVASGSTLQLATNLVAASSANANPISIFGTLDCQSFSVSPGNAANTFSLQSTGILRTSSATGVAGAISGFTPAPSFASGGTFEFTGTTVNTGFAGFSGILISNQYTITWLGSTSLTLDKSMNLNTFNFTNNGLVYLGNFNISLPSFAGALTGSGFGVGKMFVTNGTGTLNRAVIITPVAQGLPFTWPIGENNGTLEYSPVTINSIASQGINGSIGFRVVDDVHPDLALATSYITRYWPCTVTGFNATYTLGTSTFNYDSGTDVVVGPEASLRGNSYNGTTTDWTQYASSSAGANVLTITTGIGGASMPTGGASATYDITARIDVPVYYRTISGGSWSTPGIWEISSSPSFGSTFTPVNPPTTANSDSVIIRNTHTVNVNSVVAADEVAVKSGGVLNITTGGNYTLPNGPGATDMRVDGQLLVATPFTISASARLFVTNLVRQTVTAQITTTGAMQIGATGTYEHATASGASVIPTATWDVGSTCLLKYAGTTLPTGLGQAFHHFTLDADPGTTGAAGVLNNIGGNLTLLSTGGNDFKLGAGTNYTINVGGNVDVQGLSSLDVQSGGGTSIINITGNLLQAAGTLITRSGSGTFTWNVTGDFIQSGGTFQLNVPSSTGNFNLRGNLTNNGAINAPSGTRNWNFVKTSGVQTITQTTGTMANAFNWSVGDGTTTTNTLQFLSNVNLGASGSPMNFTVKSGSTVDFGTNVLSASNGTSAFVMQNNTSLITANPAGINTSGGGSVQMGTRTYTGASNNNNFTYNSTSSIQSTGTGLPTTMNSLTINNTGGAGNNTVSMTSNNHVITTLNLSNGLLAIGAGNTTIIASGGTVNATSGNFATGSTGGMVRFSTPAGGSFTGTCSPFSVETNGNPCGINFGTGTVTIQSGGVFNINAGGFVNSNAPAYASGSSLWYLTGGVYGRGLEWSSTSGKGYPHHVVVGTSTLNPASAGAVNANVPFQCAGNLTINSGGNIYMDYSGNNMIEDLRVLGNLNLVGNLSGSGTAGSDIFIGGNWNNNGVATTNFFPNGRQVEFNGSSAQSIGGSNTTNIPFAFLAISNSAGNVTANRAISVNNRLQMNSGLLVLGNNNLVLNSGAFFDQGGPSSYVVTDGTGTVTQEVNTGGGDEWYPVGPTTTLFGPVTLRQSGTTDNISIAVKVAPAYTNAVNDNTQMVQMEWTLNEGTAGGNNLRTIFGWTASSEAGSFDRTSGVYHGNWNGTKYVVRAANATTGTDPYYSLSTVAQPYTGNLTTQRFVVGNINGILPCFQTLLAGDWNTATNWVDLVVPPTDATVCINHAMTLATNPPNPSGMTINAGGSVSINNGVTLTFQSPAFITNASGVFQNMTTGTIAFSGLGVVNGAQAIGFNNLQLNGNTTFTTVPTINNEMEILSGGFVISANGPNYGASSTLKYNTGGSYNRSNEWRATSGPGYPANVLVTGNTDLNLDAGTGVNRNIQGNLQVDNGSSISQGASTFALTVPGNFTLNGAYTQSTNIGGDMILGGNWNSGASASLTSNNRDVRFNSSTSGQTITVNNSLSFGFLTIDNSSTGVTLATDIRANTFHLNSGRTFNHGSTKIIINTGGNVQLDGTFNANSGTIEYTNGGNFTNTGTFNRGTSTVNFLGTLPGTVVGTVQTNFHNIYLAPNGGVNFNTGAIRGRVSGTLEIRSGSYVTNAPIYEPGSTLKYNGGGTYNRNTEWDPATLQNVELDNNTTLYGGFNGTGFTHTMAGNLTVNTGSTFDMTSNNLANMTAPVQVGGNVNLTGALLLSNAPGGDLEVGGSFTNNGGTFSCNGRLTTFNGSANASILGSTNTNFCLMTVNKPTGSTLTAGVPFTSSLAGGTIVRVQGGTFDLNGQAITLGGGTNVLRVDAGFGSGQTLKTGGTNIGGFNTYTDDGVTTATLGGKVDYSGAGAETLISSATTYNKLWITGGATKSITQTTTANGDVNIDPATTLDFGATAAVLNAKADIVNQGTTIGTGLGKIELNGTVIQNMSGNGTYRNLDINNLSDVNSTGTPTISSKLNVIQGKVLQASLSDSIILNSAATLTETIISPVSQHFVRGKVHTTRVVGAAAETFGGLGVSLTAGSNLGTVEVTRLSGVALISPITSNSGILRSWKVTPSVQPALPDRNITFNWPSQDDNSLDMTTAMLYKRTDGTQPWLPVTSPTNVSASNPRTITYANIPSFSEFTVSDLNNPLPLDLLSFSGRYDNGNGVLSWVTANEKDMEGFQIMKSLDGIEFTKIGFSPSLGTSGQYQFVDKNLIKGSYYKLIPQDKKGNQTESRVIFIQTIGAQLSEISVYPNPGANGFTLRLDGADSGDAHLQLTMVGADGKEIFHQEGRLSELNNQNRLGLDNLPNGVYILKINWNENTRHIKWVKQ